MEVSFSAEYEQFRRQVQAFIEENWISKDPKNRDAAAFRRQGIDRGYLYRGIPRAYGGSEQPSDPVRGYIIEREFARSGAPGELTGGGPSHLTPTLLAEGEDWQKEMFIPKTLTGDFLWCQGYSEPGAGSDLAGIAAKARLEGDDWVLEGQKIWTSNAHRATHMYALMRTEPDAPKHDGISYLLLRMDQPGVTVRPLKQISGGATFNEVFFTGARTPKDWIVGKRGQGWAVSRTLLAFERNNVGAAEASAELFEKLLRLARGSTINGLPALQDQLLRDELMKIHCMVNAHRFSGLRQLTMDAGDHQLATGSFNKLYGSTIAERIARTAQKVMNDHALAQPVVGGGRSRWIGQYMNSIAAQIGGGTSNIHRNIIAERRLGLPREPEGTAQG